MRFIDCVNGCVIGKLFDRKYWKPTFTDSQLRIRKCFPELEHPTERDKKANWCTSIRNCRYQTYVCVCVHLYLSQWVTVTTVEWLLHWFSFSKALHFMADWNILTHQYVESVTGFRQMCRNCAYCFIPGSGGNHMREGNKRRLASIVLFTS
jgi:hypothetical protein